MRLPLRAAKSRLALPTQEVVTRTPLAAFMSSITPLPVPPSTTGCDTWAPSHRLPDHLLRTGRPRHRRGPRPRRHGPARHRARSLGVLRPGGLFIGIAPRRPNEQPGRASEPGFCHLRAASPARTPAAHSDHNSSTQMLNYPRTHSPSAAQYPERPSSRCSSRWSPTRFAQPRPCGNA
jgi:hypothetical protein